jgi:hypothetical protein
MKLFFDPHKRSPSQWPGTARSSIDAGRSLIETASTIWPSRLPFQRLIRLVDTRANSGCGSEHQRACEQNEDRNPAHSRSILLHVH